MNPMAGFDPQTGDYRDTAIQTAQPDNADQAPLPVSYNGNRIALMARDPAWAHAYWEINIGRINDAVAFLGGGKAFVRLIEPSTERIIAEYETWAERGHYWMALPAAGRTYRADLALTHEGRTVVLGRSNILKAPPDTPMPLARPMFIGRAQQHAAMEQGRTLVSRAASGFGPRVSRMTSGRQTTPAPALRTPAIWLLRPGSAGSEGRLFGIGSELRLSGIGSERRLLKSTTMPVPFTIGRLVRTPAGLAVATNALAGAIARGGNRAEIAVAAKSLVMAMGDAGTPLGVAVVLGLLPGGSREATASTQDPGSQGGGSQGGVWTAVVNPDGSVTVTDPGGTTVALGPLGSEGAPDALDAGSPNASGPAARIGGTISSAVGTPAGVAARATALGIAEALGWTMSAGLALLAVVAPATAEAPTGPIDSGITATPNPDGSVTLSVPDGTTVTLASVGDTPI